jgi:hypothetical protein
VRCEYCGCNVPASHTTANGCVDALREQLAAALTELDLVANSIGTLKLCDDINIANKDAMTAIIVHIDRFLKRAKEVTR